MPLRSIATNELCSGDLGVDTIAFGDPRRRYLFRLVFTT